MSAFKGKPQSLLSPGPIKSWLTTRRSRRRSSGRRAVRIVSGFLRPALAERCSTDKKVGYGSIDGALQTRPKRMIEILTSWLNSLPAWALAIVLCAFFLSTTLIGIVLVHPLMRRMIHSERQANDVVIFAAANYGLISSMRCCSAC